MFIKYSESSKAIFATGAQLKFVMVISDMRK